MEFPGRGSSTDMDVRFLMKRLVVIFPRRNRHESRWREAISLLSGGHIKLGVSTVNSFLPAIQAGTIER